MFLKGLFGAREPPMGRQGEEGDDKKEKQGKRKKCGSEKE